MLTAFFDALAVSFDLPILDWIQAHLRCGFLDAVLPVITVLGDDGIFWIAVAVVLLCIPKTRRIGLGVGFALLIGLLVCNMTLKPLIARIRPYDLQAQNGVTIVLLVERLSDYSFPSGHTIASFEAATVLMKNSRKMGIPALILAVLIAFSRLYLYVHYPTDVIFAVFAGILFGFLGNALAVRLTDGLAARRARAGK